MLPRSLSLFLVLLGGRQSSAPRCCRGVSRWGSMGSMTARRDPAVTERCQTEDSSIVPL